MPYKIGLGYTLGAAELSTIFKLRQALWQLFLDCAATNVFELKITNLGNNPFHRGVETTKRYSDGSANHYARFGIYTNAGKNDKVAVVHCNRLMSLREIFNYMVHYSAAWVASVD